MIVDNNIHKERRRADNLDDIRTRNSPFNQIKPPRTTSGAIEHNEVSQTDSSNDSRNASGPNSSDNSNESERHINNSSRIERFVSNSDKNAEKINIQNVSVSRSSIATGMSVLSAVTFGICLNSGLTMSQSSIATSQISWYKLERIGRTILGVREFVAIKLTMRWHTWMRIGALEQGLSGGNSSSSARTGIQR